MMEYIKDFIRPELLILIPVLYFIGIGIKRSEIKDKWIPFILSGCGVALAFAYCFSVIPIITIADVFTLIFVAFTQGILGAGMSVYFDQLIKQANKKD